MRKHILVMASIVVLGVALGSCAKKAPAQSEDTAKPTASAAASADAYVMLQNLSLNMKDGDAVKYAKAATIADRVSITGQPEELKYKGKPYTYVPILAADGKEYYARSSYIVKADHLAVVRDEKCVQYNEPRIVGATTIIVPRLTIVAVVDPSIQDGFIKVTYALPAAGAVENKWIKREAIVDSAVDIQAAVSLAVVAEIAEKDKALKINILEGAISSYASSVFADDLTNLLLQLNGTPVIALVPEKATYTVGSDDVNVRPTPSIDGDSRGKLNTGDVVEVVERTAEQSEVTGIKDYWYHVTSPMDGWVFGAFLQK